MSSSDPTFSNYTSAQAHHYAQVRSSYSTALYNTILRHHTSTGGRLNVLADVGCGPGNATRDLAPSFDYAIGLDPGVEMINTACQSGGHTATHRPVTYAVSTAEDIARVIPETLQAVKENEGIDLLTAAMAAHWFDMTKFWAEAARIVRPQGTVALWTCASLYCHPATPNATAVQNALTHLEREILAPHELPPNRLSRDLYSSLVLPWAVVDESQSEAFPISGFVRMEWDRDGIPSDGEQFFNGGKATTLNDLESSLGSASMVTRWREAHPALVGTADDCVKRTIADVRTALEAGDGENPVITVGSATVLLLFKRK